MHPAEQTLSIAASTVETLEVVDGHRRVRSLFQMVGGISMADFMGNHGGLTEITMACFSYQVGNVLVAPTLSKLLTASL